jgi:hypothetical protein
MAGVNHLIPIPNPPRSTCAKARTPTAAGHAWIYSNEIDTARSPLKAFEPGQAVK